jgi:hypothetical protein
MGGLFWYARYLQAQRLRTVAALRKVEWVPADLAGVRDPKALETSPNGERRLANILEICEQTYLASPQPPTMIWPFDGPYRDLCEDFVVFVAAFLSPRVFRTRFPYLAIGVTRLRQTREGSTGRSEHRPDLDLPKHRARGQFKMTQRCGVPNRRNSTMQFQMWLQVKRLFLAVAAIGLMVSIALPARADIAFSQNFNSGPPIALGADPFWSDNSEDNGYVVKTNTGIGPFAMYPITHDASGNGYFLFDGTAGTAPSGQTVVFSASFAVTANTNYTVSFDLTNANNINVATIQAAMGGVLLGTSPVSANGYFTDGNSKDQWQQFSFTWNSGSATSTTLALNNYTTTGTGNDFGIDNIQVASTPEPSTFATVIACGLGMIAYGWRRCRKAAS